MALKATIFKAELHIADMDRHYYEQHSLTIAQHPSETDERLMVRLLAFAMYADQALEFGKGISEDEPALWKKDLTGAVDLWIVVGQPMDKILLKACGVAKQVVLLLYGSQTDIWWENNREALGNKANLMILQLPYKETQAMAAMAKRNMEVTCNIEGGHIMLMSADGTVNIEPVRLRTAD